MFHFLKKTPEDRCYTRGYIFSLKFGNLLPYELEGGAGLGL